MEFEAVLLKGMWAVPVGWKFWLGWMILLNLIVSSFYFRRHQEARFILFAFLVQGVIMAVIADTLGFVRLLGIAHIIFWTPLMVYLFKRVTIVRDDQPYFIYIITVLVTNCLSLVIDYVDVGRYILGERQPYVIF